MKRWALSAEEKQELADIGWGLKEGVLADTLTQNTGIRRLLALEQNHIFWGSHLEGSLLVILDGRGSGRDLFKSIAETKLLISILKDIAPEKPIRLVRIFAGPKTSEARFWIDIVRIDNAFSSIEILVRFDDCFLLWKAGAEEPIIMKRTLSYFSGLNQSVSKTRTYRNLFGPQSERILKYYLLAGCIEAGGRDLPFPTSLNQLAALLGITQSSVSRTFAALEENGFIYRYIEKRSMLPQIIAGRRLLDAWWDSQMQRVLSGSGSNERAQDFIYLKDPSPINGKDRMAFLEKDVFTFLDDSHGEVEAQKAQWALSGQSALRLLQQSISNEESIVIHVRNFTALNILVKALGLVPASKREKGILVIRLQTHSDSSFIGLIKVTGHHFWISDAISLYLDTVFAPIRSTEQREYLLETVFAPHFKNRGWRL